MHRVVLEALQLVSPPRNGRCLPTAFLIDVDSLLDHFYPIIEPSDETFSHLAVNSCAFAILFVVPVNLRRRIENGGLVVFGVQLFSKPRLVRDVQFLDRALERGNLIRHGVAGEKVGFMEGEGTKRAAEFAEDRNGHSGSSSLGSTAAAIFSAITSTESRAVSKPARSGRMPLYSATCLKVD